MLIGNELWIRPIDDGTLRINVTFPGFGNCVYVCKRMSLFLGKA